MADAAKQSDRATAERGEVPAGMDDAGAPVRVRVRMYRALEPDSVTERSYTGLLGDCFLLTVERGGCASRILIDCGILLNSPDAEPRMRGVAADIVRECGGDEGAGRPGRLDLLILTHEHWDHLSGFAHAKDILLDPRRLEIGRVWMAWTEDPADPQALALRRRFDGSGAALAALAERIRTQSALGADGACRLLYGLDGFLGLAADGDDPTRPRLRSREVMEQLKQRPTDFLSPGVVVATPGQVSLTTYVLGPPRNAARLFKDKPSPGAPETYLVDGHFDAAQMLRFADGGNDAIGASSPFARHLHGVAATEATGTTSLPDPADEAVRQFVRQLYYGAEQGDHEPVEAMKRRRIDTEWLGAAGGIALKLDSDTNNTSLALAFELPDAARTILLFPGDAQVGSWLSWHEQRYLKDGVDTGETAAAILGRTLLYKVGHHGSHNATLHEKGLAMMTRADLFALLPTDEALARQQGAKGWSMPDPRLNAALRQQTQGRILRNDRRYTPTGIAQDPDPRSADPAFFRKVTDKPLYLEIVVP